MGDYFVDKRMKILIVDDFASMRQVIKRTLVAMGFSNIHEAAGGPDAVRKIEEGEPFGLIISDWNMPQMTGLDLLNFVRANETMAKVPFLMITAEGNPDNIIQAAKAGVSQYIVKPFTAEALQQKLEGVFSKQSGRGHHI
jgi:two-component system chemotaxis response regulator CheY